MFVNDSLGGDCNGLARIHSWMELRHGGGESDDKQTTSSKESRPIDDPATRGRTRFLRSECTNDRMTNDLTTLCAMHCDLGGY